MSPSMKPNRVDGDGGETSDAMRYERLRQRRCSRSFFSLLHSLALLHSQLLH